LPREGNMRRPRCLGLLALLLAAAAAADARTLSGTVTTAGREPVEGASVVAHGPAGEWRGTTDEQGRFRLEVGDGPVELRVEGSNLEPVVRRVESGESEVALRVALHVPRIHESVVIVAAALDPRLDRRNGALYRDTLFSRDDQVLHTLDAGINAGQHEGGGKSLEVRRFGFNLDHGGVGGGLKVLVDGVQQNQATQGHGQGYLGDLKSVTPELIDDVDVLNGPFSAQYGDFSGLGVVHLRYKQRLEHPLAVRLQGGSFDGCRAFAGWSPRLASASTVVAYEGSRTDGPFLSPLRYRRDNVTLGYTRRVREGEDWGVRLVAGRNEYHSSGQLPLDEVEAGRLDRFGVLDPDNGGRVRSGTLAVHYRRPLFSGSVLKADAFAARSLFDLWSNFTFFLADPENGDEVQQHDSRLQEGANLQVLHPFRVFGRQALLTAGVNLHANQITVSLLPSVGRVATGVTTVAHADVWNGAGYVQQSVDVVPGRVHLEVGLRYDHFGFDVDDGLDAAGSGRREAGRVQPKAGLVVTPSAGGPLSVHLNYGRGIASQDARGVVRNPDGPPIAATDFKQLGVAWNPGRFGLAGDVFVIDRSHEQVYVPDDGSLEFAGPSRSHGFELKAAAHLARGVSLSAGLTRVLDAYYKDTSPRVHVDSAPHTVASAAVTVEEVRGFSGSLRYRHVSDYRLDGEDPSIRASGQDVLDLSLGWTLNRWSRLLLSVDNLTDHHYYETQNFFESRLRPGDDVMARIHATPGNPRTLTLGVALQLPDGR
jgi:TonB-dependent receptor-like protein/carboxypeptidase family protein